MSLASRSKRRLGAAVGAVVLTLLGWLGAPRSSAAVTAPVPPAEAQARGAQLFQANCARCHGSEARGTDAAPDLTVRVRGMSEERFREAVLRRYAWTVPAAEAASPEAAREALLAGLVQPRAPGAGAMPAWEGNPEVRSGVDALYRFLAAKAAR